MNTIAKKLFSLNKLRLKITIAILILGTGLNLNINSQILRDTAALRLVRLGIDDIYRMQFDDAREVYNRVNSYYPGHPVVILLKSMIIYWENYPLIPTSPARSEFENQLRACMNKCEKYDKDNEAEFLLASLCARGMLLLFYADNDLNSKLFPLAKNSYRYLRKSFGFTETYPDFYFFTGLYNYYREAYPAAHPVYKPLLFLFPRGDKTKGLKELRIAFEKSIFLQSEASYFLSSNYKYFENDFAKASYFSKTLFNHFPSNIEYRANCVEDLLLSGQYDEAEKLLQSAGPKSKNAYYEAQLDIFRGIIDEKKHHDNRKAENEYTSGIHEIEPFGTYGSQYAAYAYFGLSRISSLNNDKEKQKAYRKKALELTDFAYINFDK